MEKKTSYFTEETMKHLILKHATRDRWLFRSLKAMIACKLTLVYGPYHTMSDLQSLAASGFQDTYEHAEILASFLTELLPSHPTTPSELMQTSDDYSNEAIEKYKEYQHLMELLEGDCFYPKVAEKFCKKVYKARNYYTFKAFANLNYSIYAQALLLYQISEIDYKTFVDQFQEISLFSQKRMPLTLSKLKLFIKTMNKVADLYFTLLGKTNL
jgi:hypothetical protein